MRSFFLTGFLILLTLMTLAQQQGKVTVIQDPAIEQLVQKHIAYNASASGIPGFRIQIFFDSGTNSKVKAASVYDEFRMLYPDTQAYLTFVSPNYKVRAGDFRSRLDAYRFLQLIQPDYPNAYVVADQILLPVTP